VSNAYTPAINDTLKDESASPWLREQLEAALERAATTDGSPLRVAQDAARLHTLLTDWFIEVSAGRLPQPVASARRNHYWISVQQAGSDLPDIEQVLLSRDEESNVRSRLMDMQEAEEIESFEMTEYDPSHMRHADVEQWIAGLRAEPEDEDRERCDGCDALLEAGRIGLCDECTDQQHPDTDAHRSGCAACQMVHDSRLPNSNSSSTKVTA